MKRKYLLIVDIDGTINTMGPKFSRKRAPSVKPLINAREILEELHEEGAKIIYLTGRSGEMLIPLTKEWLKKHKFPEDDSTIFFHEHQGYWTWERYLNFKVQEIKELSETYPDYTPIALDDNADVIRTLKNLGVNTFLIQKPIDWTKFHTVLKQNQENESPELVL